MIKLMRAIVVVLQLGKFFEEDPCSNENGCVISNQDELDRLLDLFGIASENHLSLHKT